MTTLEKIRALAAEFGTMSASDCDPSTAPLVEMYQIARGFGIDPMSALMPASDAEADQQVDALIALLYQVRGDDLPPFDLERHIRDATATDGV